MKNNYTKSESRTHNDAIGCKKMIVLMIAQALKDIKRRRGSVSYLFDWKHAYTWILSDSFKDWCNMIDFDYLTIRKQVIHEVKKE